VSRSGEPIFFCFCGPVASGKSTIVQELLRKELSLNASISTTTRSARDGEKHGLHYFFVSEEEFERRVQAGMLIEETLVAGKRYGTEVRNCELAVEAKSDLLLDIDFRGARSFKEKYPGRTVTIFVVPPSLSELQSRVSARGGLTAEQLKARLDYAREEIEALRAPGFSDYLILNGALPKSVVIAESIIEAERNKMTEEASVKIGRYFER
jgi:guanylate kinase